MPRLKTGDYFVILITLLMCLFIFFSGKFWGNRGSESSKAVIRVGDLIYASYPLSKDRTVRIEGKGGHYCVLRIEDRRLDIIEANCPDKVCVNTPALTSTDGALVCLPAEILVTIEGEEGTEKEYDAVSQ
ncbi:MAG: NusG domain II-containing protein [Lachnospiraceae bacterium]|nr:NusG domain II-containing protein [Lachnospiraceae bacterium]